MERKVKYSYEFKLRCIKEVLEQHYSVNSVAKRNGVDNKSVDLWLSFYQKYGSLGLLPRRNTTYSVDFKLNVLKKIKAKSLALSEACLEFNIPTKSIIITWQRDFANFGVNGLNSQPRGRPKSMSNFKRSKRTSTKPLTREEELLLENERLRCELDLLKKLQALIQAEKTKKRKP